jgi:D-alanyl-lipoteichoic acid acyltransferase DltB (MBOAT superfamily)
LLFNSYPFLFLYLPLVFAGYYWIARYSHAWAAAGLGIASLVFYGWWDPRYVPLLLGSIVFNFLVGRAISEGAGRAVLVFGIAANLALLGFFKYAGFFVANVNFVAGAALPVPEFVLPLGISFFTFTQIMFLVDAARGEAREYRFSHYLLFVSYFPHLIMGPLLHHRQIMPQFAQAETYRIHWENIAVGLTIFAIGLAKKVLLADNLAPYADGVFEAVHQGRTVMLFEAWIGVLAFTFQVYFDFSGYSDMAIGLARLFNVKMPLNFASPYKATSLIDMWRRWHMTLTMFLRDYVYIPLGGNRKGAARHYANVVITMMLCGLWHGSSWAFVIFGFGHGAALVINHVWRRAGAVLRLSRFGTPRLRAAAGWMVAFSTWVLLIVLFRAHDLAAAGSLYSSMFGGAGVSFSARLLDFPALQAFVLNVFGQAVFEGFAPHVGFGVWGLTVFAVAAAIVFLAPNTQQLFEHYAPAQITNPAVVLAPSRILWQPTFAWALAASALVVGSIFGLSQVVPFVYFQF